MGNCISDSINVKEGIDTEFRDRYVGREIEIEKVVNQWNTTRVFGIYGQAGVGKSRFARHVSKLVKDKYWKRKQGQNFLTIIIDLRGAKSSDDLRFRFLAAMGLNLNTPSYAGPIRAVIENTDDAYIFIIDNAEDLSESEMLQNEFLQNCAKIANDLENVHMLITSRVKYSMTEPTLFHIHLPTLDDQSAKLLLSSTAQRDFGQHTDALIERCAGNPLAIKMIAITLTEEPIRRIDEVIESLHRDRLSTLSPEEYAFEEQVGSVINSSLRCLEPEQIDYLAELNYMENTFSPEAAAYVLGFGSISIANESRSLHALHRRCVIEVDTVRGDNIRLKIHDLIRDWANKNTSMKNETETKHKFADFYAQLMNTINQQLQSRNSTAGVMELGYELNNFNKLLLESQYVDSNTYKIYKDIALNNRTLIEKYLSGTAESFYKNVLDCCRIHGEKHDEGILMSRYGSAVTNIHHRLKEGMEWYNKATEILQKDGQSLEMAQLLQHKGWNQYEQGNIRDALELLGKAYSMEIELKAQKSTLFMQTLASLGVVHTFHGDYEKGEKYHHEAINLCEELLGRGFSLGAYYNNISINYKKQGKTAEALRYSELSLEMKRESNPGPDRSVVISLNNLAMNYSSILNDHKKASKLLTEANDMRSKLPDDPFIEGYTMENLCQINLRIENFHEAASCGKKAVAAYRKQKPDGVIVTEALTHLGQAYHGSGRYKESYDVLMEAAAMEDSAINQMPKELFIHDVYKWCSRVCLQLDKTEEAREHYLHGCRELSRICIIHKETGNSAEEAKLDTVLNNFKQEMKTHFQKAEQEFPES